MIKNLQLFAEQDLKKQSTASLKKVIASFREQILEHERKISNPKKVVPDWEKEDPRKQSGLIRHWKKEIPNFKESIDNRLAELKARGEKDE